MCIRDRVKTVHDISLGGIITAIAKMCIKGKKGIKINALKGLTNKYEYFFGEDQARYIIVTKEADVILEEAVNHGIKAERIGQTGGKQLTVGTQMTISICELLEGHQKWLPSLMDQT